MFQQSITDTGYRLNAAYIMTGTDITFYQQHTVKNGALVARISDKVHI